jgi:hypothetical protein
MFLCLLYQSTCAKLDVWCHGYMIHFVTTENRQMFLSQKLMSIYLWSRNISRNISYVPRPTYLDEHKIAWTSRPRNISYISWPRGTEEHNRTYVPQPTEEHKPYITRSADEHKKMFFFKMPILFASLSGEPPKQAYRKCNIHITSNITYQVSKFAT